MHHRRWNHAAAAAAADYSQILTDERMVVGGLKQQQHCYYHQHYRIVVSQDPEQTPTMVISRVYHSLNIPWVLYRRRWRISTTRDGNSVMRNRNRRDYYCCYSYYRWWYYYGYCYRYWFVECGSRWLRLFLLRVLLFRCYCTHNRIHGM